MQSDRHGCRRSCKIKCGGLNLVDFSESACLGDKQNGEQRLRSATHVPQKGEHLQ